MDLAMGRLHVTVAITEQSHRPGLDVSTLDRLQGVQRAYNRELTWRRVEAERDRLASDRLLRGSWRP